MHCKNCGKELVGAGIFCQACGARQGTQSVVNTAPGFMAQPTAPPPAVPQGSAPYTPAAPYSPDIGAAASPESKTAFLWLFAGTLLAWVLTHILSNILSQPYGGNFDAAMSVFSMYAGTCGLALFGLSVLFWKRARRWHVLFTVLAGLLLGALFFCFSDPFLLWPFYGIYYYGIAWDAARLYALALPAVALGQALGLLLLSRGRHWHYLIVRAGSVVLFFVPLYIFYWGLFPFLPAALASELLAAVLYGVFAAGAKHTR